MYGNPHAAHAAAALPPGPLASRGRKPRTPPTGKGSGDPALGPASVLGPSEPQPGPPGRASLRPRGSARRQRLPATGLGSAEQAARAPTSSVSCARNRPAASESGGAPGPAAGREAPAPWGTGRMLAAGARRGPSLLRVAAVRAGAAGAAAAGLGGAAAAEPGGPA